MKLIQHNDGTGNIHAVIADFGSYYLAVPAETINSRKPISPLLYPTAEYRVVGSLDTLAELDFDTELEHGESTE